MSGWRAELPNLIIAGVRKGGTTSLANYLAQHPEIRSSKQKKVGYFLPLKYGETLPPPEAYAAHFAGAADVRYRMEAAPGYFLGAPEIPTRMAELLDDPRVIITLREPVSTLWSYYRFVRSHNRIDPDMTFEAYLDRCRALFATAGDLPRDQNAFVAYRGCFYAEPLEQWFEVFDDRLLIVPFEELLSDPASCVGRICRWLDIDPAVVETFDLGVHNKSVQVKRTGAQRVALEVNRRGKAMFRQHPRLKRALRSAYYAFNEDREFDGRLDPGLRAELDEEFAAANRRLGELLRTRRVESVPEWARVA